MEDVLQYSKSLNILYVEDNVGVVASTLPLFEEIFKKVIVAYDGLDGLAKFNENHIDIIITDINMPNLNGLDMLKKIKKLDKTVPSIIMTAYSELEYYKEAIDINVKGYIIKPLELDEILEKLKCIVEEKIEKDLKTNKIDFLLESNAKLIDIGYQISTQKNHQKLLEIILKGAQSLSSADGGTLYSYNKADKTLEFKIVLNQSLDIQNTDCLSISSWKSLDLYDKKKNINKTHVAVLSAIEDRLINIHDIYQSDKFDFSGAKIFDKKNHYKTTSMLVIPLKNRENELIGVIQLINKLDKNKKVVPFTSYDETLITSMASQATMMIENNKLVDDLEILLYSLIKSIGSALNAKSSYTAKHIDNVAILSQIIANGINQDTNQYKDVEFSTTELEEIKLAALLHDIGKISTPVHIVDKSTKLETIYDRIETIKLRFELLKKATEILYLKNSISQKQKDKMINSLDDDFKFIQLINNGDTIMTPEYLNRLKNISKKYEELLTPDEIYNLSVKQGTLTDEDRDIINNHVNITYDMLKEVPFPNKYSNVPKIAGSHHITIDGKGYGAKELFEQPLTLQDKVLIMADIFEALSALDRPYRKPNTLNQIAHIFVDMVEKNKLDKDLVKLFFTKKLYKQYVDTHFTPSQIDTITVDFENF